jgi:predicted nucleotidyltransferase
MDKIQVREIIKFFERCLKEDGVDPARIILFGSQSREQATPESDIDLAIVSGVFRGKDIFQRAELSKQAEIKTIKKYLVPLDIIDLTPEEFENDRSLVTQYVQNGEFV